MEYRATTWMKMPMLVLDTIRDYTLLSDRLARVYFPADTTPNIPGMDRNTSITRH